MENNIKFTVIISKLDELISETNIKLVKDENNLKLKEQLVSLLKDKETIYNGNSEEINEIFKKYGVK